MKNLFRLLIIASILVSCGPEHPMEQKEWGDWEFRRVGESTFYEASVPGCVHTDLLANNLIEDPFFGDNEKELQWIGESVWEYSTLVFPDPWILEKENIELVFEGLDTYAKVYLNDSLIISADNMFRTWKADVTGILNNWENNLLVTFSPPGEINEEKAAELPYPLPDKRAFTRKSPYHFGWDWGPEFITCGIWKPVYFRAWNDFRIDRVHVEHGPIDDDPVLVNVHITIESDADKSVRVQLFDEENLSKLAFGKVVLKPGKNSINLNYKIEDPELWWPAGLGDQKMYSLRIKVMGDGDIDEALTDFGIREIRLIREPDEYGESFYFKVNGLPVFMKGANYVPQDNFLPGVDTARYERLIESVVDANMNMLRVWGGGFYENDIFYDLCDKNGIMVWQDFMFACNMYPGDKEFLLSVEAEAIDNVSRLSNHPCIALWCGNNEVDEGWQNWGWQKQLGYSEEDSAKVWNDYIEIFHNILPEIVETFDPGTIYRPSSPMTGWGRSEAYTQGDVHYWGVWWGDEPFEMYRLKIGRFMSEYGFQGMPPVETIESFGGISNQQPVTSNQQPVTSNQQPVSGILESHQKHPRGTELIQKYMEREFIVPEKFGDYVYVSQVLQAEGMGQAFNTHRIAQPYCMGTLYWQLNDCWPVTSWAGLDYYGRWKALHYHVKRAYAPIMVRAIEKDSNIMVFVINDHPEGKELDLCIELSDFDGKVISKHTESLDLPPQSNQMVYSIYHKVDGPKDKVLVADMLQQDSIISRSFYYFVPTKEMDLKDPGLTYVVEETVAGLVVNIHANKLARQVFLEAKRLNGRFEDNFFDMAAGETRKVRFIGEADASALVLMINIKSIYDTYN